VGGTAYCNDLVSVSNHQANYSSMAHLSVAIISCWMAEKESRNSPALYTRSLRYYSGFGEWLWRPEVH
jgi:hypothetical protein